MKKTVRRIVTAQGPSGKAYIMSDGSPPGVFDIENGPTLFEVWKTAETPARLRHDNEEPAMGPLSLQPPPNGSVFRIADIPPDPETPVDAESAKAIFEQMGNADASTHGDEGHGGLMHRTPSLDYGIVLEGSITLLVDDDEVDLTAGDVVIQRGSNHAWSNRSGKVCRMAFVMLDAAYPTE